MRQPLGSERVKLVSASGKEQSHIEVCLSQDPKSTQNAAAPPLEELLTRGVSPGENMPHTSTSAGPIAGGGGGLTYTWGVSVGYGRERRPHKQLSRNPRAHIWFPCSMEQEVSFLRETGAFPHIRKPAPMRNLDLVLQETGK